MPRFWSEPNTKDAYRLSWASVIATLFAAIAGIALFGATGSSLVLVFGLESCVDLISSIVVLWRFFAPAKLSPELEEKLQCREKRASIGISFILLILGLVIFCTSIADFARGEEEVDQENAVIAISFFSILIFGSLAAIKFHFANLLESASLYKDGLCSLIGTILSGLLFVNTLIIQQVSGLWWIDPLVSLCCGIGAFVLGTIHIFKARYRENLPIFALAWWALSQGDGANERSEIEDTPERELEGKGPDAEVV